MSKIEVNVVDQVQTFVNMPVIASGDINADKIQFTFSEHWDGYEKTCVFISDDQKWYGLIDSNNEVIIPSGTMQKAGYIHFGVSAIKDGITRTSNTLTYGIVEGAYTEVDPTEGRNLITLIQDNVEEMRTEFDSVVDNLAYLRLDGDNEFEYQEDITSQIMNKLIALDAKCLRFSIGSYEGQGEGNVPFLQPDFTPIIVIVYTPEYGLSPKGGSATNAGWYDSFMWLQGQSKSLVYDDTVEFTYSANNHKLSWFATSARAMCNRSGITYNYIIVGMDGELNVE